MKYHQNIVKILRSKINLAWTFEIQLQFEQDQNTDRISDEEAFKYTRAGAKKYFVDPTIDIYSLSIKDSIKLKETVSNDVLLEVEMNGELVKLRKKHGFVDNKNLFMITYPGFERLWIPPEIEEPEVFSKHFSVV